MRRDLRLYQNGDKVFVKIDEEKFVAALAKLIEERKDNKLAVFNGIVTLAIRESISSRNNLDGVFTIEVDLDK